MKSEEWRKESISETECNRFLSDSCRASWNKASKAMQAKLDAQVNRICLWKKDKKDISTQCGTLTDYQAGEWCPYCGGKVKNETD